MVSLCPILPSDQERMLDILTSEKVNKTYMLPDFRQREDAVPLFVRLLDMSRTGSKYVRAIALNGDLIGFVNQVETANGAIELGYVIHPDFHNRGYMTQALKAAIEELFTLNYERVVCGAFEENKASQRVMEKAGMKKIEFTEIIEYRGLSHTCVYCEKRKEN